MNVFRRKSLKLTEPTSNYKGEYLGNVSTNVARGEKCTDRPLALLWSNYNKTAGQQTLPMVITIDNSGLKVVTQTQGLTHYWCHRVSHFTVSKSNPRIFVWIYRHVAKKLKVELRCHAILMKNEKKVKHLVGNLTEKMTVSLQEYKREKAQKQRRRLLDVRAADYVSKYAGSLSRTKHLSPSKNYKPPAEYSLNSPSLQVISEDCEETSSQDDDSDEETLKYSTIGRYTMRNKFRRNPLLSNGFPPSPDPSVIMTQPYDDHDEEYDDISGFATLPRNHRMSSTPPNILKPTSLDNVFLLNSPSDALLDASKNKLAEISPANPDVTASDTMPDLDMSSVMCRGIPDGEHQDPGIPIEERMPFARMMNKYSAPPALSVGEEHEIQIDDIDYILLGGDKGSPEQDRVIDGGECVLPDPAPKSLFSYADLSSRTLSATDVTSTQHLQSLKDSFSDLALLTDSLCSQPSGDFDSDFSDVEIVRIVTRL